MVEREWSAEFLGSFTGLVLLSGGAGGSVYVGRGGMPSALSWFRDAGLVILGMEGFATDGLYIHPLLEYIADFSDIEGSWRERVERSGEAAARVLDLWGAGPAFVDVTAVYPDD